MIEILFYYMIRAMLPSRDSRWAAADGDSRFEKFSLQGTHQRRGAATAALRDIFTAHHEAQTCAAASERKCQCGR